MLRTIILLFAMTTMAMAKPPPGADLTTPEAHWVQSLRTPDGQMSCCDVADCRKTEYRIRDGHIEAVIEDQWITIPDDKIVRRDNPTGSAWVCYNQYFKQAAVADHIFCFVGTDLF